MEANLKALESRQAGHVSIQKYAEIAQIMTGRASASAQDGVAWVSALVRELGVPPLSAHGMTEAQIPEAVEKTMKASSTKGNPIVLTEAELMEVLERAM
jgi:alcohol dehydrogenase class IV